MHRFAWFVIACVALTGTALAAPPPEELVQGLYEGTIRDTKGTRKLEARVVATGDLALKVFIRVPQPGGKVTKIELDGKIEGGGARFTGKIGNQECQAAYLGGVIKGTCGTGGRLEMKRVVREPPSLGAKPPAGAIVLLGGKDFSEVVKKPLKGGKEQEWITVEGGGIQIPKGGLRSKRRFGGSFRMHVEFKCPLVAKARGQGRGNSGVFLPCGQEIQVLDSFGMTTYTGGGCGGLYKYKDPDAFDQFSLASLPPLQWQTYDIAYGVKKTGGKPVGNPVITVLHNGITIHDNHELKKKARTGGFSFQDHGNPVHYRNIWVLPLN